MPDVLLIGTGPTAWSALESLTAEVRVVGVVRDASHAADEPDAVVQRARELDAPVYPDSSPAAINAALARSRPDCVVVSSYNRKLGPELLAKCPFVNVHYAPLPRYRGCAPVNWAILNGEPYTAITIHTVATELDAGNILFQRIVPIAPDATVAELFERLNRMQQQYLGTTVLRFLNGYTGVPQGREVSYGCRRFPSDGEIDWAWPTRKIDALVRALGSPYPGAYTYHHTRHRPAARHLIVWEAYPVNDPPSYAGRVPGRVVRRSVAEGHVDVLTGDGVLRLVGVQLDGDDRTAAAEVIRSVNTTLGIQVADLLERIEVLEAQLRRLSEVHQAPPTSTDMNPS